MVYAASGETWRSSIRALVFVGQDRCRCSNKSGQREADQYP
jgi:hypothetical protein